MLGTTVPLRQERIVAVVQNEGAARLARLGRLRRALPVAGQGALGAVVCGLWLGLASPSLQLLPGIGGLADESIEISLQSAMLGIEDGSGRPDGRNALAAADVLGLSFAAELLADVPARAVPANGIVRLDPSAARLAAALSAPDEGPAAEPVARTPQPVAPTAAGPPPAAQRSTDAPTRPEPAPPAPVAPTPSAPAGPAPAPKPDPVVVPPPAPSPGVQEIEFASQPPAALVAGDLYEVAATSSSGVPVALSVGGDDGVCSLSGTKVIFHRAGTCVVIAKLPGTARLAAAERRQLLQVGRAAQTVAFTSAPPSAAQAGGTYEAAAASSTGLPVTLAASGACSLRDGRVRLDGPGLCTVHAEQAGDEAYAPASAEQSFSVALAPVIRLSQSIAFTSTPPSGAAWGNPGYAVSAAASSGLPVALSLAASSAGVCSLAGGLVSLDGVGTCTILADQGGSSSWLPADQVEQSFTVGKASQTVSISSPAPSDARFEGADYAVSASASSGLPVSFSLAASSAGVCSLSGSTVSMTGVGTCTVRADQAGDGSYEAAAQAQQSFTVAKATQSVSFSSAAPSDARFGGADYAVSASASSGLPVALSLAPASAGVCSLSGSTVSMTGVGTCTILADQAGDGSYEAAAQAQQSFAVAKASQTVSFTSSAPSDARFGGAPYAVSASASSGLPVALSLAASSAGVCSLSGSTVSMTGVGTCTVRADQAGNGSYEAATQAQQSFAVAKATQTVSFTSSAPSAAVVGGATYAVSASASSGLPVSFGIAPASAGVCSLSGSTVSMTAGGTCTILADQAGNGSYEAATQAQQSFAVAKASQTVTFTSTAPSGAVVGGATYAVSASASSGLTVSFSIAPASAGVCSLSGSTVSMTAGGTCTILADQTGNGSYEAATQAQQSFAVAKASQTVTFTSTPPSGAVYGGAPYVVSASASSGLPASFSLDPASAGTCSLSGSTVSMTGVGTCTVRADQAGNGSYEAAAQAQQSFAVAKAPQTITFTSTPPVVDEDVYFYNVTATATSGLSVGFSTPSSGVCAVFGAWVWFYGNGTCLVWADQAGDANWAPAPRATQSILVTGKGGDGD
jgi:hypothetical protein